MVKQHDATVWCAKHPAVLFAWSLLLGFVLAASDAQSGTIQALAQGCPAGTTPFSVNWGAAGGVVLDEPIQNDGFTKTFTEVGGSPVDMTLSIADPSGMNEDQDNVLVNLPTADGAWDGPVYTGTDVEVDDGFLTASITSANADQPVQFSLEFSAPVLIPNFAISDVDFIGNNVAGLSAPHDSFQDEIVLSAFRGQTPVEIVASTGSADSPVVTVDDSVNGSITVVGGPYDNSTSGDLQTNDLAGLVALSSASPITKVQFDYSNGPDDAAGDADALAAAGGAWPQANFAAPLTSTDVGVSNNHAVSVNSFVICTGTLSLGDTVWADIDADGVLDPGEPGVSDVEVALFDQDMAEIASTVTDANGEYAFYDLPPWDYTVIIGTVPGGYVNSFDRDSGTAAPNNSSGIISLDATDVEDADFGLAPPLGTIDGTVFASLEDDGTFNPADGETPIAAVEVALQGTDLAGNSIVLNALTEADGTFSFTDVPAGTYTVTESQPAGFTDGTDTPGTHASNIGNDVHEVILGIGDSSANNLFAEEGTVAISGSVFEDFDLDAEVDGGEPIIAGVQISLSGLDDAGNAVALAASTDSRGNFTFNQLRAGTYTLTETQPDGFLDGPDAAGTAGGDTSTNDVISGIVMSADTTATGYLFGEVRVATISGSVIDDLGAPIPNVELTLSGTDDLGDPVSETALTDGDGEFIISDLTSGTYDLVQGGVVGYLDGPDYVGSVGGDDSVNDQFGSISIATGVQATGYVFTEISSSISGTVVDNDGIGIEGVTLNLTGEDDLGGPLSLNTVTRTALTDANGDYSFQSLASGSYSVAETQPLGYGDGGETAGSAGGAVSDDLIANIALAAGTHAIDNDFDEIKLSLGGNVFVDAENNGLFDRQDTPLENVAISLNGTTTKGQNVSVDTVTDSEGSYEFPNLEPGDYSVTETQPLAYGDGIHSAGSDGGDVSVANVISNIVLDSAFPSTGNNFAEVAAAVEGTIFTDDNNDGVADSGELGIENAYVSLTGTDDFGTPVDLLSVTGPDGFYRFDALLPGNYTVTLTAPEGYLDGIDTAGSAGGDSSTVANEVSGIDLDPGANATGYLFGVIVPSSIGGVVQAGVEVPIEGVAIVLNGTDDLGGAVSENALTGVDGRFGFANLRPGNYALTQTQPTGYGDGAEVAGSTGGEAAVDDQISGINLGTATDDSGYEFNEVTSAVSGEIFHDLDGDGTRTPDESGISGVPITLTGTDDLGDAVSRSSQSDSDGTFSFAGLLSGSYSVSAAQPPGFADGTETAGSAGGTSNGVNDVVSDIALPPGFVATGYTFAETGAVVAGTVWVDSNGNGIPDADEPGRLEAVELTLVDSTGAAIATTSTDANGRYGFGSVVAGTYTVDQIQPEAYATSTPNSLSFTVETQGLTGIDFGESPASISGLVWNDNSNPNGVREIDEPGAEAIRIQLVDADGVVLFTTSTSADGTYRFGDLPAGNYGLIVLNPDGSELTIQGAGADAATNSEFGADTATAQIVLEPGVDLVSIDAGIVDEGTFDTQDTDGDNDPVGDAATDPPASDPAADSEAAEVEAKVTDLTISIDSNTTAPRTAEPIRHSVTTTNSGNTVITGGIMVKVEYPDGLVIRTVTEAQKSPIQLSVASRFKAAATDPVVWTFRRDGQIVTASWSGDLAPGQSAPGFNIDSIVIAEDNVGIKATVATADGTVENTLDNNSASYDVSVDSQPPVLAFTGASSLWLLLMAIVLLILGSFFRWFASAVAPSENRQ